MTQFDFGEIDPGQTPGAELAELLGDFRDALNSCHRGANRPAYAVAGTIWVDTSGAAPVLNYFDGANDRKLFEIKAAGGKAADADLLDGQSGSFYRDAGNLNAGRIPAARLSGTYNVSISGASDNATKLGGVAAGSYLKKHSGMNAWNVANVPFVFNNGSNEDSYHHDETENAHVFRSDAPAGNWDDLGSSRIKAKFADFEEWHHPTGLKVRGLSNVTGISIGRDAADTSRSGRLFFEGNDGAVAIDNNGGSFRIYFGGTYDGSSGSQKFIFRPNGSIFAPYADGANVAGPDDLFNQGFADGRYLRNSRLGAEVTQLFAGYVGAQTWYKAASGQVMTGIRIGPVSEGGTRVTGMTRRPVQKHINGAWVTVSQA